MDLEDLEAASEIGPGDDDAAMTTTTTTMLAIVVARLDRDTAVAFFLVFVVMMWVQHKEKNKYINSSLC